MVTDALPEEAVQPLPSLSKAVLAHGPSLPESERDLSCLPKAKQAHPSVPEQAQPSPEPGPLAAESSLPASNRMSVAPATLEEHHSHDSEIIDLDP